MPKAKEINQKNLVNSLNDLDKFVKLPKKTLKNLDLKIVLNQAIRLDIPKATDKLMQKMKIDLNKRDKIVGKTILQQVIENGSNKVFDFLVDKYQKEIDLGIKDNLGANVFDYAAKSGDQDKFNILLKIADQQNFKIDFNAEGKLHSTIHYAVLGGNAGIIKTLIALDVGITTNDVKASKSIETESELARSLVKWHELLEQLKDKNKAKNTQELEEKTDQFLKSRNSAVFIDAKDKSGSTLLNYAAIGNHVNVVENWITNGANVNSVNPRKETPLHNASCAQIAKILIRSGANANAKNSALETPLHNAAFDDRSDVVNGLLSSGAKVNARGKNGGTPLYNAALGTVNKGLQSNRNNAILP